MQRWNTSPLSQTPCSICPVIVAAITRSYRCSSEPNWQENSDHSVSPQCRTKQVCFWKESWEGATGAEKRARSRLLHSLLICQWPHCLHKQPALFTPSPWNGLKLPYLSFQTVCFRDVKQALRDWKVSACDQYLYWSQAGTFHQRRSWGCHRGAVWTGGERREAHTLLTVYIKCWEIPSNLTILTISCEDSCALVCCMESFQNKSIFGILEIAEPVRSKLWCCLFNYTGGVQWKAGLFTPTFQSFIKGLKVRLNRGADIKKNIHICGIMDGLVFFKPWIVLRDGGSTKRSQITNVTVLMECWLFVLWNSDLRKGRPNGYQEHSGTHQSRYLFRTQSYNFVHSITERSKDFAHGLVCGGQLLYLPPPFLPNIWMIIMSDWQSPLMVLYLFLLLLLLVLFFNEKKY